MSVPFSTTPKVGNITYPSSFVGGADMFLFINATEDGIVYRNLQSTDYATSSIPLTSLDYDGSSFPSEVIPISAISLVGANASMFLRGDGIWATPGAGLQPTLVSGQVLVGNSFNIAYPRTLTGDITLSNTGVVSLITMPGLTAGIYGSQIKSVNVTVDAKGRITAISHQDLMATLLATTTVFPAVSSNVLGVLQSAGVSSSKLRITSGNIDTENGSLGASLDLYGNSASSNNGNFDAVAGTNNGSIRFFGGSSTVLFAQFSPLGKLVLKVSTTGSAGFNIPYGIAPSSPATGDIWTTSSGLFVRINATSQRLFDAGGTTAAFDANGKLTFQASTTTAASLNVPYGVAPSSPVTGDIWTTSLGLFARINTTSQRMFDAGGTSASFDSNGKLTLQAASTTAAGFNMPYGVAPSFPVAGDVWTTSTGLFAQVNGVSQKMFDSSTTTSVFDVNGKLVFQVSSNTSAGLNIPYGAAPTSPVTGDVWTTSLGLFAQIGGVSQRMFDSRTTTAEFGPLGKLILQASAASSAPLNIPYGVAPSSPVDGDIWSTSAGVFAMISGVVKAMSPLPIQTRTVSGTTDTILATDFGGIIIYTSAAPVTVTVPASFTEIGSVTWIQAGTGKVTFSGSAFPSGTGLIGASRTQYSIGALIFYIAATAGLLSGDIS